MTPLTQSLVEQLSFKLLAKGWMLSCAESCTGGLIAAACTDLAGSSRWFERGFVSYSNASKVELLGVDPSLIAAHGAVSQEVARAMALGALTHSAAQVSLSVTGVAGPTGGSADKPVGCVWFGWALASELEEEPEEGLEGESAVKGPRLTSERMDFAGTREAVRAQTVEHALSRLLQLLP